jgi:hypothetical protein
MSVKSINHFVQAEASFYENDPSADFDVLPVPVEISAKIFSEFLEKKDLAKCATVSKTWRVIADDDVVWKEQAKKFNVPEKLQDVSWKEACRQKDALDKAELKKKQQIESAKKFNHVASIAIGFLLVALVVIMTALAGIFTGGAAVAVCFMSALVFGVVYSAFYKYVNGP